MDARETAAALLATSGREPNKLDRIDLAVCALSTHLIAMDEDIQKIRKELRTRNGGESDARHEHA